MCCFLFPIYSGVHAAVIKDNLAADPFKTWTINFNQKINFDNLSKSSISVSDSKGKIVPVNLSLSKDSKSILISPPSTGYNIGETYKLKVASDIHSEKNKHLNETETISFNVTKELSDNDIKDILKNAEDNIIKMCYSRDYTNLYADGKTYLPFKEEFNSQEKVYTFLQNYYTDEMSKTMMNYLGTRYVGEKYAEVCGDWGDYTSWESITITNKHFVDSNTLEFVCDFFDKDNYSIDCTENNDTKFKPDPKHYYSTYRLKQENGKWLVAYNSDFK